MVPNHQIFVFCDHITIRQPRFLRSGDPPTVYPHLATNLARFVVMGQPIASGLIVVI